MTLSSRSVSMSSDDFRMVSKPTIPAILAMTNCSSLEMHFLESEPVPPPYRAPEPSTSVISLVLECRAWLLLIMSSRDSPCR